jgi:microcystin-dependent protein
MPIRINLKELFPSDSQDSTVDKINFNFNKLLELGIGEQGLRGFSGIQGSAGPSGIVGPAGERGNAWFLDANPDPNTLSFTDLIEGDFYLDSLNFAVWQYNGTSWDFVFDLTNIINTYLASSPSPFVRGFGLGSPNDDRFILFNRRGDPLDTAAGGFAPNSANNDILFLNNFNENLVDFENIQDIGFGETTNDFNALLKIYNNTVTGGVPDIGRYHIELGTLYDTTIPVPAQPGKFYRKLTNVHENLKIFFKRDELTSSIAGLTHFNKAIFSMDAILSNFGFQETNGVFEFSLPKVSHDSSIKNGVTVHFSSRYGMDQLLDTENISAIDGIMFSSETGALTAAAGIAADYNILNSALTSTVTNILEETGYITNIPNAQSYLMLDKLGANDIVGIYLNNKILQNGGNIVQVATTPPRVPVTHTSANGSPGIFTDFIGHMGIAVSGNQIYTVSGDFNYAAPGITGDQLIDRYGYINKFTIENPNNPTQYYPVGYAKHNGLVENLGSPSTSCSDSYGDDNLRPIGIAMSDIDIAGNYAYVVNSQIPDLLFGQYPDPGDPNKFYRRTYFQILKLNSVNRIAPERVSTLGWGELGGSVGGAVNTNDPFEVNAAYRVKVKGNHAIVANNALHTDAPFNTGLDYLGGPDYDGRISAINVSDPTNPLIVATETPTTLLTTGSIKTAILDLDIVDDTAVTLTWEQQLDPAAVDIRVKVDIFDLSQLESTSPSISWKGRSSSAIFSTSSANLATWSSIVKRGAIVCNKRYIYAGYGNIVRIYALDKPSTVSGTYPSCEYRHSHIAQFVLPIANTGVSGICGIYDLKQLGNSLYILAIDSDQKSYAFKYDISGGLDESSSSITVANSLIWQKDLSSYGYGTRMQIIGKHIYVATHNSTVSDTDTTSLVPLDFDGIYTGGAHIESLRADAFHVTGSADIGQNLNVANDATIGGSALVSNNVSVGGIISGIGSTPIGSVTAFAGSAAPAGWLLCNGSPISRTIYSQLYSIIGTAYGIGDGSSTFNIPNLQQRVPVGLDPASGFNPLGHSDGEVTHLLTSSESGLPAHTHTTNSHSHGLTLSANNGSGDTVGSGGVALTNTGTSFNAGGLGSANGETVTVNSVAAANAAVSHNNMQPYLIMNYIIYAGV